MTLNRDRAERAAKYEDWAEAQAYATLAVADEIAALRKQLDVSASPPFNLIVNQADRE